MSCNLLNTVLKVKNRMTASVLMVHPRGCLGAVIGKHH